MSQSDSLGLPQVAACLLVGYFVFRWFFKSSDSNTVTQSRSLAIDPRLQEQSLVLTGMFPQVSIAAAQAELIRNGGSIEIATDKIVATGGLPEPPAPAAIPLDSSVTRPTPTGTNRPAAAAQNAEPSSSAQIGKYQDLITRYNLHGRLHEEDPSSPSTTLGKGKAPQTKSDRQLAHQSKRDEMILTARRRMEEMDRK